MNSSFLFPTLVDKAESYSLVGVEGDGGHSHTDSDLPPPWSACSGK